MQGDVRAGVGIRIGGEIAGVGFAADLEHGEGDALWYVGALREPFALGPRLEYCLGVGIPFGGERLHVLECAEDEQGFFQSLGGQGAELRVSKQGDQELDVVAPLHRGQEFSGALAADQRRFLLALRNRAEKFGLDLSRVVYTGWDTVADEVEQEFFLSLGRIAQQGGHCGGLLCIEREWRDAQCSPLGGMFAVGVENQRAARLFVEEWWGGCVAGAGFCRGSDSNFAVDGNGTGHRGGNATETESTAIQHGVGSLKVTFSILSARRLGRSCRSLLQNFYVVRQANCHAFLSINKIRLFYGSQ